EDLVDVERHDVTHKRIAPKPMVRAPTVPQMMRIVMAMTHIIRCHQRIGASSNWTCAHAAHILLIASPCSCSCCRMPYCHRIRCGPLHTVGQPPASTDRTEGPSPPRPPHILDNVAILGC